VLVNFLRICALRFHKNEHPNRLFHCLPADYFRAKNVDPTLLVVPWHFNTLVYFTVFHFILDDLQALLTSLRIMRFFFFSFRSIAIEFFRVSFTDDNRQQLQTLRDFVLFTLYLFLYLTLSVIDATKRRLWASRAFVGDRRVTV
jgi:hypothetical protein